MSHKLSCIIVDDEPLALRLLESYASRHGDLELLGCFTNSTQALEQCGLLSPDVVFLDINMPGIDGIEFAGRLDKKTRTVFITAYDIYALDGFKVNALDYLLKPASYEDFCRAVERARDWKGIGNNVASRLPKAEDEQSSPTSHPSASEPSDYLTVRSEYRLIRVPLSQITHLEGLKDYVKIWCAGQDRPILTLASLKSLETRLAGAKFMRVHRSYIVNLDHVKTVRRNRIEFDNRQVPVSETFRKDFMTRLGF